MGLPGKMTSLSGPRAEPTPFMRSQALKLCRLPRIMNSVLQNSALQKAAGTQETMKDDNQSRPRKVGALQVDKVDTPVQTAVAFLCLPCDTEYTILHYCLLSGLRTSLPPFQQNGKCHVEIERPPAHRVQAAVLAVGLLQQRGQADKKG